MYKKREGPERKVYGRGLSSRIWARPEHKACGRGLSTRGMGGA